MSKVLVLLADLHVGATSALLPPDFETHEGYRVSLNPVQKWLWKAWGDCWQWARKVIGKDEWAAIVNGDAVEGIHHNTKEVWSPDEGDHVSAATDLLHDVLEKASAVYMTEGTNCHAKNLEHGIAAALSRKGIAVKKPAGKMYAWPELRLNVAGTPCEIDHHMPTTMRSYLESSQFAITLGDIRNQRARAGWEVPKVIIRSHRHRFGLYEDGYGMMLSLPSWQASNRFTHRVVPGMVPQVGLVVMDFRNVEAGGTPVIHKRLHTIQAPSSEVL